MSFQEKDKRFPPNTNQSKKQAIEFNPNMLKDFAFFNFTKKRKIGFWLQEIVEDLGKNMEEIKEL